MPNFLPSLGTLAKGTLATAATFSAVGVGLLYYGQNYLIYPSAFPPGSRIDVPVPIDFGIPYQDLELKTPDGIVLRCYLLPQDKALPTTHPEAAHVEFGAEETGDEFLASRPTVIMFHGNGGNHGHRIPLAKVFYMSMRCNVLMLSYRGCVYNACINTVYMMQIVIVDMVALRDRPQKKVIQFLYLPEVYQSSSVGLRIDAQTALDYLTSHPHFSRTPIVLYGQSIGGAVAIDLASRNPSKINALILENTFTSLPTLIPHALPLLGPFSFLCHQKWDSASKIPLIPATTPILMLSGVMDQLVPKEHMRALWEIVAKRGEKKTPSGSEYKTGLERARYMEFQYGGHNDTCVQSGYWNTVAQFVASLGDTSVVRDDTSRTRL